MWCHLVFIPIPFILSGSFVFKGAVCKDEYSSSRGDSCNGYKLDSGQTDLDAHPGLATGTTAEAPSQATWSPHLSSERISPSSWSHEGQVSVQGEVPDTEDACGITLSQESFQPWRAPTFPTALWCLSTLSQTKMHSNSLNCLVIQRRLITECNLQYSHMCFLINPFNITRTSSGSNDCHTFEVHSDEHNWFFEILATTVIWPENSCNSTGDSHKQCNSTMFNALEADLSGPLPICCVICTPYLASLCLSPLL